MIENVKNLINQPMYVYVIPAVVFFVYAELLSLMHELGHACTIKCLAKSEGFKTGVKIHLGFLSGYTDAEYLDHLAEYRDSLEHRLRIQDVASAGIIGETVFHLIVSVIEYAVLAESSFISSHLRLYLVCCLFTQLVYLSKLLSFKKSQDMEVILYPERYGLDEQRKKENLNA